MLKPEKPGYKIPKGWKVFSSFRAVHLDPNHFKDARTFNPWRWQVLILSPFRVLEVGLSVSYAFLIFELLNECNFDEQSNSVTTSPSNVFTPFGGGPRLCPGYELARVALSVFLHRLVTGFT